MQFEDVVQEATCRLQSALTERFRKHNFFPAPSPTPAWIHVPTETYINLQPGESANEVELFFDGRSEGSFLLPMVLEHDNKEWAVLPNHLAEVVGHRIILQVDLWAQRRVKGFFCPTDWHCETKRHLPKGNQLLAYTKITTPAGVLYAQRSHRWVAYLPGYFDADTGDGTGKPVLLDQTLNGLKTQLYWYFVEGKLRNVTDLAGLSES